MNSTPDEQNWNVTAQSDAKFYFPFRELVGVVGSSMTKEQFWAAYPTVPPSFSQDSCRPTPTVLKDVFFRSCVSREPDSIEAPRTSLLAVMKNATTQRVRFIERMTKSAPQVAPSRVADFSVTLRRHKSLSSPPATVLAKSASIAEGMRTALSHIDHRTDVQPLPVLTRSTTHQGSSRAEDLPMAQRVTLIGTDLCRRATFIIDTIWTETGRLVRPDITSPELLRLPPDEMAQKCWQQDEHTRGLVRSAMSRVFNSPDLNSIGNFSEIRSFLGNYIRTVRSLMGNPSEQGAFYTRTLGLLMEQASDRFSRMDQIIEKINGNQ